MNVRNAKAVIKEFLDKRGLPYTRITAKTVSFSDLARGSAVFVQVHGWKPNPAWTELKEIARQHNVFVEAK